MPRHERDGRDLPLDVQGNVVRLRRTPEGKLEIASKPRSLTEETRAEAKPPLPEDPRSGPVRNIPPYGAA